MSTDDSPRADPLAEHRQRARWRFIGALIFAVLASAVSYSVLLDTPRPLARDFTVLMPMGAAPAEAPAPAAEPPAAQTPASPPVAAVAEAPTRALPAAEEASPTEATPTEATPKEASQPFVQVGAYASRATADQTRKRLEAAGHKVVISTVGTGSAQRFRVRIGPLAEEDAQGVVARAKLQGYDAVLVRATSP